MLSVDRKKTDKVDWVKPLQQFIRNSYSAQIAQDYQEALNSLQQLREDVRNVQDRNDAAKDLLLRYYAQLLSLENRFPIGENNIRVSFVWYDIFKAKKVAEYTIHYEKACVLFNAGAVLSQVGALQNRSSVDGLKVACQNFQAAAGAFQYLKDEIEKHPQPNVLDLNPEFITVLINLMLAQAQECFYEKAVKDNMKAAIVAKLAAQTGDFYDIANNLLNSPSLSALVPKNWSPHVQLKSAMFKAAAQYRVSITHGEADEYGSQLGRLQIANRILEDAKKKHLKNLPSDVQQVFNTLQTPIVAALTKCEKENDTIYHDTVPAENKLAPIEKKVIVKALPLQENLPQIADPFAKLIPFAVTQKLSVYQEKKDSLVRNEVRMIDEQNQLAIASLSSMNLPGAIEALETPGDKIPQTLLDKMNTIKSEGGACMVLELIETLNKLAEEDSAILDKSLVKLDTEEKEDNSMRQQYGSKWQRTPSHTLTINLRQEIAKYKGNIEHARKSDAYVMKKFQDHQQFIVKLSSSQDEIKALLPSNSAATGETSKVVADLKQSLSQLDKLIAERATIRNELTGLSQSDDITSKLLNNTRSEEEVYAEELKKYESHQTKLQQSYSQQSTLLSSIQKQNAEFVSKKQSNNQNAQREQVLQQLNTAFKIYNELKNNLREGIQFYTNFQDILKQFSGKCEDFVFARQTEKQDLLSDIQRQATGVNTHVDQPQYMQPQQPQQQHQPQQSQPQQAQMPGMWQPNMGLKYGQPTAPSMPSTYNNAPSAPYGTTYNYPPNQPMPPMGYQQPYGAPQMNPMGFQQQYQPQPPPNQQYFPYNPYGQPQQPQQPKR